MGFAEPGAFSVLSSQNLDYAVPSQSVLKGIHTEIKGPSNFMRRQTHAYKVVVFL